MQYAQRLLLVKHRLIDHVRGNISHEWDKAFHIWLKSKADMTLGYAYQNIFNQEFSMYTTPEVNALLWLAGKSVVHAISAFMEYREDPQVEDLLDFIEKFISEQMDDFDNWCDEVSIAMYEEEHP